MSKRLLISMVGLALGFFAAPQAALAVTYFVNAASGNDSRTPAEAQNPATPWKTIKTALGSALAGDTVKVSPGTYKESVESKVDGVADAPIVLQFQPTVAGGAAIIQPPLGNPGFYISHNYHVVDGFTVTGATVGIRLGDHDGGGSVRGLLVKNNTVSFNTSNGIQVTSGLSTEISFNTVYNNGANGISYSGNSSVIHDNVVHHNGQFGIYVKDGVDHVVYDNTAFSNTQADLQIVGATVPTYYVDCQAGDDARTPTVARNSATPWRTIKFALAEADAGDTVMVLGGTVQAPRTCSEGLIESKRPGSAGALITIKAATPGTVIVDPPSGNGFRIKHDYHRIEGFVVTGATNGIQVEASGVVISNNRISDNQVGIKISGTGVAVMHNVINNNTNLGINVYATGTRANIFNNLVYSNGSGVAWGIEISSGNGHRVTNNTVWGHSGGIRLGTSNTIPVFSTVVNNIVVNNGIGIKEPSSSAGIAKLEFNDVFANTTDYDLSNSPTGSVVGASSLSQDPRFVSVDPANPNFLQLSGIASGQSADSPCIDKGSTAADTLGLGSRSVFTNQAPDTGRVDLGYHWPRN